MMENLEKRLFFYGPAPTVLAISPYTVELAYALIHVNREPDNSLPLNVNIETKDPAGVIRPSTLEGTPNASDNVGFYPAAEAGSTYQIRLQGEFLDGLGAWSGWTNVNTEVPEPTNLTIDGDSSVVTAHWESGGSTMPQNPINHQIIDWYSNGVNVRFETLTGDHNGASYESPGYAGVWHYQVANVSLNPFDNLPYPSDEAMGPSVFIEPVTVASLNANSGGIVLGGNNGVTPCLAFNWTRDSGYTGTQHFTLYKQKSGGSLITVASADNVNTLTDKSLTGGAWTYSLIETVYDVAGNPITLPTVTTAVTLNQLTVTSSWITTSGTTDKLHFALSGALPSNSLFEMDAQSNDGALHTTSYTAEGTNGLFATFIENSPITGAQVDLRLCCGFTFVNQSSIQVH